MDWLNKLEGHRTHILVFITTIGLLIRTALLPHDDFVRALDPFGDYVVSIALVLLGSKSGDAIKKFVAKRLKTNTNAKSKSKRSAR